MTKKREHGIYRNGNMITIAGKGFEITFPEGCKDIAFDKERGALVVSNLSNDAVRQIKDAIAENKKEQENDR